MRHGIWRVGRGAVSGVILFVGNQWLVDTTGKEKSEHRNENHEKNLHTRFLPMHRIGSRRKWQVADPIHRCWTIAVKFD